MFVLVYFFIDISILYWLFNAEIWFICQSLVHLFKDIYTSFSLFNPAIWFGRKNLIVITTFLIAFIFIHKHLFV